MMTDQYKQLVKSLINVTNSRRLRWGETSLKGRFEAEVSRYKVTIYVMPDDGAFQIVLPDTEWANLSFIDETGSVFDKIVLYDNKSADYKLLQELYESARRSAKKIDVKIGEMMSDLDKLWDNSIDCGSY